MADWFASKRNGYGSGFPIAWQGWVVLGLYLAIAVTSGFFLEHKPFAALAVIIPATAIFLLIAAKTTPGGWRWRGADED